MFGQQRTLKVLQRLFPSVAGQGLLPGQERVEHQLVGAQNQLGLGEVVGQLRGVGIRILTVQLLQDLGDAGV